MTDKQLNDRKMHTIASKVSTRDRELLPRYYYKLSEKTSCVEKITNFIRAFLTFLFTQVGVIVLIATYMLCGAAIFQNIEADSKMDLAVEAEKVPFIYTYSSCNISVFRRGITTLCTSGDLQASTMC